MSKRNARNARNVSSSKVWIVMSVPAGKHSDTSYHVYNTLKLRSVAASSYEHACSLARDFNAGIDARDAK